MDDDLDWTLDGEVPVLFPTEQVTPSFLDSLSASLSFPLSLSFLSFKDKV